MPDHRRKLNRKQRVICVQKQHQILLLTAQNLPYAQIHTTLWLQIHDPFQSLPTQPTTAPDNLSGSTHGLSRQS